MARKDRAGSRKRRTKAAPRWPRSHPRRTPTSRAVPCRCGSIRKVPAAPQNDDECGQDRVADRHRGCTFFPRVQDSIACAIFSRQGLLDPRERRSWFRRMTGLGLAVGHRLLVPGRVVDREQLGLVEDHLLARQAGQVVESCQLDRLDRTGLLAHSTIDAPQLVDDEAFGILLAVGPGRGGRGPDDVDAVGRARRRAQHAGDALDPPVLILVQPVHAPIIRAGDVLLLGILHRDRLVAEHDAADMPGRHPQALGDPGQVELFQRASAGGVPVVSAWDRRLARCRLPSMARMKNRNCQPRIICTIVAVATRFTSASGINDFQARSMSWS